MEEMIYMQKDGWVIRQVNRDTHQCVRMNLVHINVIKLKYQLLYTKEIWEKKTKEIQDIIKEADENNKSRIILATSSSIGEGFDDSRLDTLFLTMPVSWKGRIIQYVGRLHREHEDKEKVIVYDYLDNMKVLEKMYNRRIKGYKMAGYEIIEWG